jgi:hypothetical protein
MHLIRSQNDSYKFSEPEETSGIGHQYFTFTSVHMPIHVVMLTYLPMFAVGFSFSAANKQSAMTFSLIPIAHHNQFQPLGIPRHDQQPSWN